MAFFDTTWYCNFGNGSSTGHYAVAVRPQNTAVAAGVLRRQFTAPAVGSERVFVCIVAGTTANVTDATWTITRGGKTTDGTATWIEVTGAAGVNGDAVNTPTWAQIKAIGTPTQGTIIKRNNGASYQIASVGGTLGASEPAFSDTAGVTTTDSGTTWTSLGTVGNFTGGQAPHARLASACASTWFAAGNTIYVGDNHAESQTTAISIAPAGSISSIGSIICHNHSGSYPPASGDLTTGALVSTTGAVAISFAPTAGAYYLRGLTLRVGVGQAGGSLNVGASSSWVVWDSCSLELANTGSTSISLSAGSPGATLFNNTTMKFGAVSQTVNLSVAQFIWQNTGQILASGSSIPTAFISHASGAQSSVVMEALDLSQLTGTMAIFGSSAWGNDIIKDCKLNAGVTIPTPSGPAAIVQLVRCDSGATGYKSTRYAYEGTETTETSITRVGGAADPTGQAQSRKIVTTANALWLRPFKAEPYGIWNAVTGANVVVTVYGTINAGALPNNDDIWIEVEYLGSSTSPLGTIVTTTKASVLAANAAVASDSSTWSNATSALATLDGIATDVTLSNGNLTATHSNTNNNSGARSSILQTAGKYYFEVTITASHGAFDVLGILLSAGTYTDIVTNGTNCTAVYRSSGNIFSNGVNSGKSLGSPVSFPQIYHVAIDLTARLAWFRRRVSGFLGDWNGDATANPATGVGGVPIAPTVSFVPAVGFGGTGTATSDQMVANFGASTYDGSPPSGFGNWMSWSPFKLTATLSSPQPAMAGYLYARVRAAKLSTTFYLDPQIVLS